MFQQDGDPETVSQKHASLDANGFPRIAGLASEQHTFTADIAFSQVPSATPRHSLGTR